MIKERKLPTFDVLPSDPIRNPSVLDARAANSEYIVYYAQEYRRERWNLERVSDGAIVASGSLQSMLALLNLYPNSRRASWAEDMSRYKPFFLSQEAVDIQKRIEYVFDKISQ